MKIISLMKDASVRARILSCMGAGALITLALPPLNLWPFAFLGLSLFYIILSSLQTRRAGFAAGWLFGFGYFGAGLWWIANALLVEGNEFSWVWPLAVAGLPALLAFFPALAATLLVASRWSLNHVHGFLLFIATLALTEWLRGHVFTGFPWNLYGYVWSDYLFMLQSTAIGGAYGLTLLTLFWLALPGFLLIGKGPARYKAAWALAGLVTIALNGWFGYARLSQTALLPPHDRVAIKIVQPAIKQEDKWNPEKIADNLFTKRDLSVPTPYDTAPLTLIIWPETAISYSLLHHELARFAVAEALDNYTHDVFLMTGFLRHEAPDQYFNSLSLFDRNVNLIESYDKSHLVPFGEYIPFQNILSLTPFAAFEGFKTGNGPVTQKIWNIPPFSPLVCYEIIFPGAVTAGPADRPAWIVNVTNDAWYGDSPGPYQHFAQTRIRAIEEGVPVVRAANTGISGLIDPLGQVLYRTNLYEKSVISAPLPRPLADTTVYSRYGDTIFAGLLVFLMLAAMGCKYWFIRENK